MVNHAARSSLFLSALIRANPRYPRSILSFVVSSGPGALKHRAGPKRETFGQKSGLVWHDAKRCFFLPREGKLQGRVTDRPKQGTPTP